MVDVAEEVLVNQGWTTSRNEQASRCRHWCTSRMTKVDGQSSQRMRLLEYPKDAWASRVLVSLYNANRPTSLQEVVRFAPNTS